MTGEWVVVVDFTGREQADRSWREWTRGRDLRGLDEADVRIDTGRGVREDGSVGSVRRYLVRRSAYDRLER